MTRFSVAVPAWNSSPYLEDAILSLLAVDDDALEIVVSVDPGTPDASISLEIATAFDDPRLRVIQPPQSLAMAAHYQWCADHLTGDFGTIIGADDGVLPWCTTLARRLLSEHPDVDALMFRRAYYFWPGVEAEYGDAAVILEADPSTSTPRGSTLVRHALRGRIEHFDLPQFYTNNLIRLELARSIRRRDGTLFAETNPDVYSGLAVARAARRIVRSETPAFWTGTSPSSLGIAQRRAIVDDDAAARRTVDDGLFRRSRATGRDVSSVVGEALWLTAQDSPIYVLSAHLRHLEVRNVPEGSPASRWAVAVALAAARSRLLGSADEPPSTREVAIAAGLERARAAAKVPATMQALADLAVRSDRALVRGRMYATKWVRKRWKRVRSAVGRPPVRNPRLLLGRDDGVDRLRDANRRLAIGEDAERFAALRP